MILYLKDPKNSSMKHLSLKTFAEKYQDIKTALKNQLSYFRPITAFQENSIHNAFNIIKYIRIKPLIIKVAKSETMKERSGRKHTTSHDHELGADVINMDVLLKMIFRLSTILNKTSMYSS